MLGRSSFAVSRNGSLRSENLGQNALKMMTNLCFTAFVIGVLIFTIVAVTYKPQDPFLNPSSEITSSLSSSSNPTFKSDIDDVKTSNDFVEEPSVVSDKSDCMVDDLIDCSDPNVFHLLMRAAIGNFKDVNFYRFGKPVRGYNDSSCHMAWRFSPKEGKTSAFYKDYRSFAIARFDNCTLSVVGIGKYHSGGNAGKRKGKVFEKTDNLTLPVIESEGSFSGGKYLIYSGGGDRCKSLDHYLWSFMCMLGEAQYLNRTLVMDLTICLSKIHSSSGADEEGKDFRFYFDFEHLQDLASVVDQARFWSDWRKWQQKDGLSVHVVEDFRVTPVKLAERNEPLIMRKFGTVEPDNFWYRVCEGEMESVIQRPWHMIWKSRQLLDIASAIAARMRWDYDAVHVERGEKSKNKEVWPNLDRDTSPESLLVTLKDKIEHGRNLYIATNEAETSFFDPLKDKYSIHFLDDNKDLWDANSYWYYEMAKLNNGSAVEFDGYMRMSVDAEVVVRAKKQIETFNDLTKDCKYGINTCKSTS